MRVDHPDESVGRVEAYGAGENPEGDDDDDCVPEVQDRRDDRCDVQLSVEVEERVEKHVDG